MAERDFQGTRCGPRQLGQALGQALARLDARGGLKLVRLWRAWSELLGPELAPLMRPLGHRERTLILATEDPVVAQEASFLAPLVLDKVHEFLGEEVFDKVHFELLSGRVPLDVQTAPAPAPSPVRPRRPGNLGGLTALLEGDSPVARCYRAYVRLFAGQENEPTPAGAGGHDERRENH